MVFLGPALAYAITKRVCLGLQRKDAGELLHGYESGIIRQLPNGEFIEVHQPVNEERRAVLEAKPLPALIPASGPQDTGSVPAPASRGTLGRIRARAGRAFAETIPLEVNGQANGHANGERAVPGRADHGHVAASTAQLGPGDNPRDGSAGA
jgi:ubiquinol-cytochrome c reductase cytochrome b subunit